MGALRPNSERANKPISHEDTNIGGQLNPRRALRRYNTFLQIYPLEKKIFVFIVVGICIFDNDGWDPRCRIFRIATFDY